TFAIDATENDDEFPMTAVVWQIACDTSGGGCAGTYHSTRHLGDTITWSADQNAFFNPPSAVTGAQTSIDGGRALVAQPEVASLLNGPPSGDVPLNLAISVGG